MTEDEKQDIYRSFGEAVNMAPKEIEDWLGTQESKSVGMAREGESEAVGHKMGKRIVAIRHGQKADLTDDDYASMKKVVGYVHRHLAQGGPDRDVKSSDWRYSLMNWGHDPLK